MEHSLLGQKDTLRAKTVAIRETMNALEMLKKQRVGKHFVASNIKRHICSEYVLKVNLMELILPLLLSVVSGSSIQDIAKEGGDGELQTHFQLAETIHVQATVPPTDTVCLWLAVRMSS